MYMNIAMKCWPDLYVVFSVPFRCEQGGFYGDRRRLVSGGPALYSWGYRFVIIQNFVRLIKLMGKKYEYVVFYCLETFLILIAFDKSFKRSNIDTWHDFRLQYIRGSGGGVDQPAPGCTDQPGSVCQ